MTDIHTEKELPEPTLEYLEKNGEFKFFPHRGISQRTMEFYNVRTKFIDGLPYECGFILPNKSVQVKNLDSSIKHRYRTNGPYGEAGLFGTDKFDPGSRDSVTICEGFHDALSVYEMTGGQTAAVAVKSAVVAKADCIKDWEYLN